VLTPVIAIVGITVMAVVFGFVMQGVHERKKDTCGGCSAGCDAATRKKGSCTTLEIRR